MRFNIALPILDFKNNEVTNNGGAVSAENPAVSYGDFMYVLVSSQYKGDDAMKPDEKRARGKLALKLAAGGEFIDMNMDEVQIIRKQLNNIGHVMYFMRLDEFLEHPLPTPLSSVNPVSEAAGTL